MKFNRNNSRAAKLNQTQVAAIREAYAEGVTQGELCREYGVSVGQIGRIVRGESWTALPNASAPVEQDEMAAAARRVMTVQEEANGAGLERLAAETAKQPNVAGMLTEIEGPGIDPEGEAKAREKVNQLWGRKE